MSTGEAVTTKYVIASYTAALGVEPYLSDDDTGVATLIKDASPGSDFSFGAGYGAVKFGASALFTARGQGTGDELWITDGTADGTRLIKDVVPGVANASPNSVTVAGNAAFFVATIADKGQTLWQTDGTEAGTALVSDLVDRDQSSLFYNPFEIIPFASGVLFQGLDHRITLATPTGLRAFEDVLPRLEIGKPGILIATAGNSAVYASTGGRELAAIDQSSLTRSSLLAVGQTKWRAKWPQRLSVVEPDRRGQHRLCHRKVLQQIIWHTDDRWHLTGYAASLHAWW